MKQIMFSDDTCFETSKFASALAATLLIYFCCLTFAGKAAAEAPGTEPLLYEIRTGILSHDVGGLWSGRKRESGTDFNLEIAINRRLFYFMSGVVRPNVGVTINNSGYTDQYYAGLNWEIESQSGIFMTAGLGAAAHNGELHRVSVNKKALGSRILFRVPVEAGLIFMTHHRISVSFAHISNAYLADPNEGIDTLGLRYGFRF